MTVATLSSEYLENLKRTYGISDAFHHAFVRAERATAHIFDLLRPFNDMEGLKPQEKEQILKALTQPADNYIDWQATDEGGRNMVMAACDAVEPDIVKAMINNGMDAKHVGNVKGAATSALIIALSRSNGLNKVQEAKDCVRVLLDAGAMPKAARLPGGKKSRAPLYFMHDAEIVKWLLDAGADPQEPDADRRTDSVVHVAVEQFLPEKLRVLLDYGAPIHIKDQQGRTPLMLAIEKEISEKDTSGVSYLPILNKRKDNYAAVCEMKALLDERTEKAQRVYQKFIDTHCYADLTLPDLMALSNIGHLKEVFLPEHYKGQEQDAIMLASELPVWIQESLAIELTSLYLLQPDRFENISDWKTRVSRPSSKGERER